MSIDEQPGRESWPDEYEAAFWRHRLLQEMWKKERFRSAVRALRKTPLHGAQTELVEAAEREPHFGELSEAQLRAELIFDEFQDFLDGDRVTPQDFHFSDTSYPLAMFDLLQRFGLVRNGLPVGWAIRPIHRWAIGQTDTPPPRPEGEMFFSEDDHRERVAVKGEHHRQVGA